MLPNLTTDQKQTIKTKLLKLSKENSHFYFMVVMSVIIATLGLIIDNAAVIIGAMLISPLMNPILSFAASIVTASNKSLSRSFQVLVKSISLSIIISVLITKVIPTYEIPQEILNRTNPSIIDLIIALAAGAAAIYSIVIKDISTIAGVGISVSLMPPLAVIGFGLAVKDYDLASGAGLLFLTNLVAIIFISSSILIVLGFKPRSKTEQETAKRNTYLSAILLISLAISLTSSFIQINKSERTKAKIKKILLQQEVFSDNQLNSFTLKSQKDGQLLISITLMGNENIDQRNINLISDMLARNIGQSVELEVNIIPTLTGVKQLTSSEIEQIKLEQADKESTQSSLIKVIQDTLNLNREASESSSSSAI